MQNNGFLPVPFGASALLATDKSIGSRVGKEADGDRCRALLAYAAMENAMALSAVEAYCNRTAPLGAHRYKLIADAYAVSAATRISRWP
jgi:hypothetical protein